MIPCKLSNATDLLVRIDAAAFEAVTAGYNRPAGIVAYVKSKIPLAKRLFSLCGGGGSSDCVKRLSNAGRIFFVEGPGKDAGWRVALRT